MNKHVTRVLIRENRRGHARLLAKHIRDLIHAAGIVTKMAVYCVISNPRKYFCFRCFTVMFSVHYVIKKEVTSFVSVL